MGLGKPKTIEEVRSPVSDDDFAAIRNAVQPVVLRGLVADWPVVASARAGDRAVVEYLCREPAQRPISAIAATPDQGGRFFYTPDVRRLNFVRAKGHFHAFLNDLLSVADQPEPPAMAVQSEELATLIPHVARENRLDLLPDVIAKIWIGNRIRVAPHFDAKENIACCVAGRRTFTLFPPDQMANLYPGPFELTPAGTPVSMVDMADPDLQSYPRFETAWASASRATLEPGDAIYIPFGWWHGVESLDPVSMLINYWWTQDVPQGIGQPYGALLNALFAIKHLPKEQRAVWKAMLDFYVFEEAGDPAAHLPDHAKGILGPPSPALFTMMREASRQAQD